MDGILCFDKPQEMTSFAACALLRRLLGEKRVGHAGTLDPMATGVLPLFFGKATRAIPLLPCHDKTYVATLQFGKQSDTLDVWGAVQETGRPMPTRAAVDEALCAFRGDIWQIPPMTSALKKDGVRLYELARKGVEVEREVRPVTVYDLTVLAYDETVGTLTFSCSCSAGTYIRSICDDLGRALGCGAVMTALRRTMAAGYPIDACLTPDDCRRLTEEGTLSAHLLSTDSAFSSYERVTVSAAQATRFSNGGALFLQRLTAPVTDTVRVYAPDGRFLGLGAPQDDELRVLRLF
ncbi:MAG: tRNA pseudouridine(55) synthase TruB [Clostridia bacterium]|nr:tRNA pseudouridine(55) synthase TruB [Clostridia bacterium]